MKKGKLIIIVIVVLLLSIIESRSIGKIIAKKQYQRELAKNYFLYQDIPLSQIEEGDTFSSFHWTDPIFSFLYPKIWDVVEISNESPAFIYQISGPKSSIRVIVLDTFVVINKSGYSREKISFSNFHFSDMNEYSENTVTEYFKGIKEQYPHISNIEKSVKRLGGIPFIFLSYDTLASERNSINRISYDFLVDGYAVSIIGFVSNSQDLETINKCLNSVQFLK